MPLVALSGGTARGQFLRVRLHSSARAPDSAVPIETVPVHEQSAGSCRPHMRQ